MEEKSLQNTTDNDYLIEKILRNCQTIIDNGKILKENAVAIISEAITATEEFSRSMWQFYLDMQHHCENAFSYITPELFLNVVKHFKRIVNQKIENRDVGATIILFLEPKKSKRFGDYPLQPSKSLKSSESSSARSLSAPSYISDVKGFFNDDQNNLQRLYKCIDSHDAFFAYTYNRDANQLRFDGIKSIGDKSIESICEEYVIGFNIISDNPFIRIYNSGHRVVDYFMSESTGNWTARFEEEMICVIKEQVSNVQNEDVKLLAKIAMQLSYLRYGAMLIITSRAENFIDNKAPCELNIEDLENAEKSKIIYNYAAYDGAVIIQRERNSKLKVVNFGVILNPSSEVQISEDYETLLRQTNSGSRHEKAVRYAHENPDDCILVVSENRSISILHGRKPVYWRDNPNPSNFILKTKRKVASK